MNLSELQHLLPDYPRIQHLPHKPNTTRDDLVATDLEAIAIFTRGVGNQTSIFVEEKLDGASLGVKWSDEGPVIRNRSHILRKGYRKETSAKMQFASTWTYFYDKEQNFLKLRNLCHGQDVSIYGEWLLAQHGVIYDKLPTTFVAYELYDSTEKKWLATGLSRKLLEEAGFYITPLLHTGVVKNYEQLETLINQASPFSSTEQREGVCVKVCDETQVLARFKKVRSDFVRGKYWHDKVITKNIVVK